MQTQISRAGVSSPFITWRVGFGELPRVRPRAAMEDRELAFLLQNRRAGRNTLFGSKRIHMRDLGKRYRLMRQYKYSTGLGS